MPTNPTRDRINPETIDTTPLRRPSWIKVRAPSGENYENLQQLMRSRALHTVCEEAGCPNMGECWGSGTATFLMLGDVCTRKDPLMSPMAKPLSDADIDNLAAYVSSLPCK